MAFNALIHYLLVLVIGLASLAVASDSNAHATTKSFEGQQQTNSNNKAVAVYFQPLATDDAGSHAMIRRGILEYDIFLGSGELKSLSTDSGDIQGPGCFGTVNGEGQFKCLAFSDVSTSLYHLILLCLGVFSLLMRNDDRFRVRSRKSSLWCT